GYQWCSTCEISALKRKFTEWTSGNIKVDNMIQQTQLLSNDGVGYLEFIPFENFEYVKYIERGAFSTIYSAIWINGPRHILDNECPDWIRNGPTKCALKRIDNSCNISQEYLDKAGFFISPSNV
ncbi:10751_t:CDS:1, partial [Gigaspora margarita]